MDGHRDEVAEDGEVADDAVRKRVLTFFSGESIDRRSLNRVVAAAAVSDGLLLPVLPQRSSIVDNGCFCIEQET